ncbi:MAG: prepilin-type N-terminal cleavage/methylation domain-containing protein [Oscillospiraceae bacterium]|nr:prepilin-type N-terminal cleavage/methylation domain-containing protein [Oscillospiraceae bacterium]
MEERKKKHSGFTLVELIIVMALFSIIMYSAVQLMQPVSKYFVRSSNYESTTSCIDNMKRAIEGNLKYADRVRCYANYKPYQGNAHSSEPSDYVPTDVMIEQVNMFWTDYFMNRQYIDYKGKIYVMVFDNTVYEQNPKSNAYPTLKSFSDSMMNAGQILLYEFNFGPTEGLTADRTPAYSASGQYVENNGIVEYRSDQGSGSGVKYNAYFSNGTGSYGTGDHQYTVTPWYVNQKMYGNYEYQFSLGDFANASTADFDPSNCTINIEAYELNRSSDGIGLILNDSSNHASASFCMKNVLDATKKYTRPLFDFKQIRNPDTAAEAYEKVIIESYSGHPLGISRYNSIVTNNGTTNEFTNTNGSNKVSILGSTDTTDLRPGFYFIFTVPETTYSVTSADGSYYSEFQTYLTAVDAKYPKAS